MTSVYDSPVGPLLLTSDGTFLTGLTFGEGTQKQQGGDDEVISLCKRQLDEYFAGWRREFSVPLLASGTRFRQRVWNALQDIPYGETITYQTLAKRIGQPKACRAVGGANHHNPISILIPCHRVVGSNGQLTGYGGGLPIKDFLLTLEGKIT